MRSAKVYMSGEEAGILTEIKPGAGYIFEYLENYSGIEISRTMPISQKKYLFDRFPAFFEGLLPEGIQQKGLLDLNKIDRNDLFSQLIAIGRDMVGAVTVEEIEHV